MAEPSTVLAQKTFTLKDQHDFADYSGDFNPMHIDATYARRSIAGAPVVHGMHLLLWALEAWLKRSLTPRFPAWLQIQFDRPAVVDLPLVCTTDVAADANDCLITIATAEGQSLATIELGFDAQSREVMTGSARPHGETEPTRQAWEALNDLSGDWPIRFSGDLHPRAWPQLLNVCGPGFAALLASSSRLVGMQCPGLNSVYSELQLVFQANPKIPAEHLRYAVLKTDPRFKLVDMSIQNAICWGKIRAFMRPEVLASATMETVTARTPDAAFLQQRALVVGGSRGIGEIAAKVLAASGAEVLLTYASGREDAEKVVTEIVAAGGRAACAKLDALGDVAAIDALATTFRPTHLFYCATPFIFSGSRESFSNQLLSRFRAFYVTGFERLVKSAYPHGLRHVWYPSSVALDEQPGDMREYCVAKAEGEALAASLTQIYPDLKIACPRLPRTATDQTNCLIAAANADPLTVFLDSLSR